MTSDPPSRRSRAGSGERTRAELLAAGADLLREQPVGAVLNQITAPEVARRAGRTIGAFYHHWSDQDSYRRELLATVLAPEVVPTAETVAAMSAGLSAGIPTEELIRFSARANLVAGLVRPELALTVALSALARNDEWIRDVLRQQYEGLNASLLPTYRAIFAHGGWVPRPPFTLELISAVATALIEGLAIRASADPDAVPLALPDEDGTPRQPDDETAWDLYSAALLALLPLVTMPVDPDAAHPCPTCGNDASGVLGSRADVRDVVRQVWAAWRGEPAPGHESHEGLEAGPEADGGPGES